MPTIQQTAEKYQCYGERELIERIHELEVAAGNLLETWDAHFEKPDEFTDGQVIDEVEVSVVQLKKVIKEN